MYIKYFSRHLLFSKTKRVNKKSIFWTRFGIFEINGLFTHNSFYILNNLELFYVRRPFVSLTFIETESTMNHRSVSRTEMRGTAVGSRRSRNLHADARVDRVEPRRRRPCPWLPLAWAKKMERFRAWSIIGDPLMRESQGEDEGVLEVHAWTEHASALASGTRLIRWATHARNRKPRVYLFLLLFLLLLRLLLHLYLLLLFLLYSFFPFSLTSEKHPRFRDA